MFYACNGAVQHLSIVFNFVLVAILGGLGQDPRLCPQAQNTSVKSAILGFLFCQGYVKVCAPLDTLNTVLKARNFRTY